MTADINKLTYGDKFGVTFEPDETIKLVSKPNLKACLGNQLRNILLQFFLLQLWLDYFKSSRIYSNYLMIGTRH